MALYCDVALPVPLDRPFTYAVNGAQPSVGARVIVPFSGQMLMGVVLRVHDEPLPEGVEAKPVQTVMDLVPLLGAKQMELARWIAQYYCAPLGEVIRGMLPLAAEVKRQFVYRISEAGRRVLYEGAAKGSSRRSKLTPEEQNREYAVLNYLEGWRRGEGGRAAVGDGRGARAAGKHGEEEVAGAGGSGGGAGCAAAGEGGGAGGGIGDQGSGISRPIAEAE